jgi:hypothetical protein
MRFRQKKHHVDGGMVALVAGVAAGAAAAVYFGWREVRHRRLREHMHDMPFSALEEATVEALRDDERAGNRAIDIAALGDGIIELTGTVATDEEAKRAVEVAQRVDGVHTVVNRLTVGEVEQRLVQTRRRFHEGDAALNETHWYGIRVGMGRRRQGVSTDPDRRDDRVDRVTRVLEPSSRPSAESDTEPGTATELTMEEAGRLGPQRTRRNAPGPH